MCCGLKQGDPLAPLLFILVMETLRISVSRAANDGIFRGLHIQGSVTLSHLFYADDAVFIGDWSESNLDNIIRILNCFYLASGLRINVSKSQVLGIGVLSEIVLQGASCIGCDILHTPFKYLGVMVGDHMSRLSAWSNSIQKIRAKLSTWMVKTLSIGGRLTILKSVLGATPIYTTCRSIKLRYQFSMRWKCFGINSLMEVTLKIQVLDTKGFDFLSHCKVRIGDGSNTRFWLDVSILDMPLCACFPRIFALENDTDVSVAVKQGAPSLDASFRRPVRDGVERL
nr:RNA-directed DNA polymerase, eukaryota [Tanacetum cinerariifolium]